MNTKYKTNSYIKNEEETKNNIKLKTIIRIVYDNKLIKHAAIKH